VTKEIVDIYTDGSSRGNPGPGGYGLILRHRGREKEISQGFRYTTNNRMELLAVIVGLESINKVGIAVRVYSDSKYVVDSINKKWVFGWQKKGFAKKKNADLWRRFLKVLPKNSVEFIWIKGHNKHEYNDRCDQLAVDASHTKELVDSVYEEEKQVLFDKENKKLD